MTADSHHDDHECRHCSGLCAGRAAKCPYCKRWLRRESAEWSSNRGADAVHAQAAQVVTTA